MDIAALIYTHNNPALTFDTLDSITTWVTPKVMVLVDGCGWHHFSESQTPFPIVEGLKHGRPASPYRNVAFGLMEVYKRFPDTEWYMYAEQDCLFLNDRFKKDFAKHTGKWFAGTNYRGPYQWHLPMLNALVGGDVREEHYVLGCIMFMHNKLVTKLMQETILERLLQQTSRFDSGHFPDFHGYAFEEQLFASLANYFKPGSILALSQEHSPPAERYAYYMTRWTPEVQPNEVKPGSIIVHPLKEPFGPIRFHYAKFRERLKHR